MRRIWLTLIAVVSIAPPALPARAQAPEAGKHVRIKTAHGPVHVWQPDHVTGAQSGVVVYVHGYYTDVDETFTQHALADQFARSGRDAVFIVPEAPQSSDEEVAWTSLGDLLRAVEDEVGPLPGGPLVVVGHSGAYRTILGWLDYGPLQDIVLLDALYGNEEDFAAWLTEARGHVGHRLTLVVDDTAKWADPFVRRFPDAVQLPRVPDGWDGTPAAQRAARLVAMRSQYPHMEVVTAGRTLPVVLERTRLRALPR